MQAQTTFEEKNWKVTLPLEGSGGKAKEVFPPFGNYDGCFTKLSDGSMQMTAAVTGFTTKGSSYPRSEFREMNLDGTKAAWSTDSGKHSMIYTASVTEFPPVKQQVVTGQIHDDEDDVIMIRHTNDKKLIEVIQDTTKYGILDDTYEIGQKYTISIVTEKSSIVVSYQKEGGHLKVVNIPNMKYKGCYFKTGCYTQSNESKESSKVGAGSVRIYGAIVRHTDDSIVKPTPTPRPIPTQTPPQPIPTPAPTPSQKPNCTITFGEDQNGTIVCYGPVYINGTVFIKQ